MFTDFPSLLLFISTRSILSRLERERKQCKTLKTNIFYGHFVEFHVVACVGGAHNSIEFLVEIMIFGAVNIMMAFVVCSRCWSVEMEGNKQKNAAHQDDEACHGVGESYIDSCVSHREFIICHKMQVYWSEAHFTVYHPGWLDAYRILEDFSVRPRERCDRNSSKQLFLLFRVVYTHTQHTQRHIENG